MRILSQIRLIRKRCGSREPLVSWRRHKRDTILVTPRDSVTIAFDANNAGWWFYHCHNLYHLAAGMATSVKYV